MKIYYNFVHFSFRTMVVYVKTLLRIIVFDMLKPSVNFILVLYIIVSSFYLALRAGVVVICQLGAITSDVELFRLQTQ